VKKRALITGINGMDGSHLADFLLEKDYEVWGLERRSSVKNRKNTKHLEGKITFITGDLADQNSLFRCLKTIDPHEVYNLAAMSFIGESWNTPEQTSNVNALGVLRILEAIREYGKQIKFYQASTSELFGEMPPNGANENTPFCPHSPYAVSKLYGHWITKNYRKSYDMFNVSGMLFNHESERRGKEFVTRKITDGVARIKLGLSDHISLGNLESRRDWGYAPDYVEAMWMMMQHETPDDYIIATGKSHSIKEFLDIAFCHVGIRDWKKHIKQDPRFMRPVHSAVRHGDSTKAQSVLGWKPKTTFEELVIKMVENDINLLSGEKLL